MYEKMNNLTENFLKPKFWGKIIGVIALLLFTLFTILIIHYDLIDYYPEANYQILEAEVERMVAENDFTSIYNLTIDRYHNKSNNLNFSLSLDLATIDINISNLGEENQTVTINRTDPTKTKFAIKRTMGFILIYVSSATLLYIFFIIVYDILLFFVFIGYKIKQHLQKTSA